MSAVEILDGYILQWNAKEGDKSMPYEIVMGESLYNSLCQELKRKVKNYKGHKVVVV